MAKRKPNKEERMKLRTERANTYEQGFNHGFSMGYEVAKAEHERGKEHGQQILSQKLSKTGEILSKETEWESYSSKRSQMV